MAIAKVFTTEDGLPVREGDVVFNYYDRKLARIIPATADHEGWFTVYQGEGSLVSLNGPRLCSLTYAISRDWTDWDAIRDFTISSDNHSWGAHLQRLGVQS